MAGEAEPAASSPKLNRLVTALEQAAPWLREQGVDFWADWLALDAARLRRGDSGAVDHLLGAFGGMGSLSDLVICPENGHAMAQPEVSAANARLDRVRAELRSLAEAVRRAGA